LENALKDPAKYGSINASSKTLRAKVLDVSGGNPFFSTLGFERQGDAYTFDTAADRSILEERLRVISAARARGERVLEAVIEVGDTNVPDVAQTAIKLARIYCQNVAAHPGDESKRRISATNKALGSRLLAANKGAELLRALGFDADADPATVYVCSAPHLEVRVSLSTLDKAEDVWSDLASVNGGAAQPATGGAGAEGGRAPEAITDIRIAQLPQVSTLDDRVGTADLQPALVTDAGRTCVQLHCWMPVSRRWRLFGEMAIPSTSFVWTGARTASGEWQLVLEVDLGDGKPVELGCSVQGGQPENEYVAAQRFINENFESLNNNHLEEIARSLRERVTPVMATVDNLKKAMEAQN